MSRWSQRRTRIAIAVVIVAVLGVTVGLAAWEYGRPRVVLATTTSTYDSGLLDYLLPEFENRYLVKVDIVSVGTGQAIATAQSGDADVLLVHAGASEDQFVNDGYDTGDLGQTHAREKLIQDKKIRFQGNGFGQLQFLEISLRKDPGRLVGYKRIPFKTDLLQEIQGHCLPVTVFSTRKPFDPGRIEVDDQILERWKTIKGFDHLKSPRNTQTRDPV